MEYRYSIMHDTFAVIDGETLETGSFNFTSAAERKNAENVIVLHDPAVAHITPQNGTGSGGSRKR